MLTELAKQLNLNDLTLWHLERISELIIVPHLALHQIPFAALPIGDNRYLGDKFLIRYAPSCQVLEFCQQRPSPGSHLNCGTIEDATGDLPFESFEGEQLAFIYSIPDDRLFRTYCANFLGKCQKSNARISKFIKFLNPKPHLFKSFNLLLIPSTIPLVVLSSKYPTISPNHLLIVSLVFL